MNKNGIFRTMLAGVALFSLLTLLAACGSGGDSGGVAGATATITLEASGSTIPADGTSSVIIRATIKDSAGNPVRHFTDVTFTTTLGYFKNGSTTYTMQTQPPLDEKGWPDIKAAPTGIAEVTFIGGHTGGSARITASSIGVTQSVYVTVTGGSAGITLTANPTTIPADGKSSTTITATLTDSSGNPVTPGTQVSFTSGLGHFLSDSKSYTVSTPDNTGIVKVALHAGYVPGTTYVVATSNDVSQALQIVLTDTGASTMSISANPSIIPADGSSTSLVTATVRTASGSGIAEVPVTFYDASISTQPDPLPDGNIWKGDSPNNYVTPAFYFYSGTVTFTMTYQGSLDSNFTVWLYNRDTQEQASLLINKTGPVTEEKVSKTLGAGNYYFQVDANASWQIKVEGSIGPAQVSDKPKVLALTQTDSNGHAQYLYTSTVTAGTIRIRAETGEPNVNESEEALKAEVQITQTGLEPSTISVGASSSKIYANGQETTTVRAIVTDKNGNTVADGTVVSFSAKLGNIDASAQTDNGVATATLTSTASAKTLKSTVTAKVGALSDSTEVYFIGVSLTDMKAEPAIIFANGTDTATISVRIRDAYGAAVEGETVNFMVESGTGTLNPSVAVTNAQGIATVQIIAPTQAGTALVTAYYGLISASTSVTFTSQPSVGSMTLKANPTTIPADGKSTSKITAEIMDTASAPVPKGTSVTFTTTLGKFSNGLQTQTVITPDATGNVSVSLISATMAGSALVTATSNSVSQSIYVGFGGAPVKIVLTATPDKIWADGVSSSAIQATVTDASGAPVTPGTQIAFTTSLGKFANGLQSYTVPTPDNTGIVTVSLMAGTTTGSAKVSASASGVVQSVYVEFIQKGGDPFTMTLTATPATLPADGASSSKITATLKDSAGNPVKPGTSVTFSTTLGKFNNGAKVYTVTTPDATGVVSVSLIAGTTAGSASVTATSNGVTQTIYVTFTGAVVASITVTATPPGPLLADGVSTSEIRAQVKDAQGNPIADGESISFTIVSGTGKLSAASATTIGGIASVTYTASTIPGVVVIQAMSSNNVSGSVSITLISSGVGTITLTAVPSSLPADGTSSSAVTAIVQDGAGRPVIKDTPVTFTTTLGKFSNSGTSITVPTLADTGIATVSLIAASTPGTATVKAESGGVSQTTTVTFIGGGQPASLTLTTSKTSVKSDNSDSATITATLLDGANAPVAGFVVAFSASTGQISASSATTEANGQAKITFSAGNDSTNRTATITATVAGLDPKSIPIKIVGSTLTLDTDKFSIPANQPPSNPATLTATAKDGGGNPAANASITFLCDPIGGGIVEPPSGTTNASGVLEVKVYGKFGYAGPLTVIADWDGTTASQDYTVTAAADTFAIVLPAEDPFSTHTSVTTGAITNIDFVGSTITRPSNSFVQDGIKAGDNIMVSGSLTNNGGYTVASVTDLTLTLVEALTAEVGATVTITSGVLVRVHAPGVANVRFATTLGLLHWDLSSPTPPVNSPSSVTDPIPVLSDLASAFLTSNLAGTASVQVYDADNPSISAITTVVFSTPSANAAQLSLQANVYTVAPSIGGTENSATLTATVRTSVADESQVVSGVAVAFSIGNPTGGGEYVEPVVTITDSAGQATATFTSGSLSSGAGGVTVRAYVVDNATIWDSIAIVIGGVAGSVVIGRGTVIYDLNEATYRLPMAALVTDSNGNAVAGAVVTLSAWPLQYAPGVWYDSDPDPKAELYKVYYTSNFIDNEDANENLILDPDEDKDGDKLLTPASSSAGGVPVPSQVVTGANGVATFDLIYLKANAEWIKTRIRARTFVVGTETTSSVEMVLSAEEQQAEKGLLPDSPFPIGLVATTAQTIPIDSPSYVFPKFIGTGDEFKTSSNLSAGKSYMGGPIDNYDYTYDPDPGSPITPAVIGNIIWDYIQVKNVVLGAYFPVRIIIVP